jgi:hypothetical protein
VTGASVAGSSAVNATPARCQERRAAVDPGGELWLLCQHYREVDAMKLALALVVGLAVAVAVNAAVIATILKNRAGSSRPARRIVVEP